MSDKTYVFNSDGGASSGLMNTIAPLLQQRGIDPAYLMGMMNNGGFGGFGNGWNDIIALIVVAAIFGNGNFGFGNNGNNAIAQAVTPLNGAVAHLQSDVDGIKCKLPKTETIIAQPDYVPVQRSINIGYAPYCYGANYGCGYGYGYGNGTNNLWG